MVLLRIVLVLVMASACGCYRSVRIPDDASTNEDASTDASTRGDACVATASDAGVLVGRDVDLLLVIDNSRSMYGAQLAIARELPRLVRGLVTGDSDGDPRTPAYVAVRSLHVAVVTTDMGVLGMGVIPETHAVSGCGQEDPRVDDRERATYGDDGVFRRTPTGRDGAFGQTGYDCDFDGDGTPDELGGDGTPSFLAFAPDTTTAEFEARVACYAIRGTNGCGMEQPLEAMLKATTPASASTRFFAAPEDVGVRDIGHAEDPLTNGGFIREGAILAVVIVSDEDDCSSGDVRMFDRDAPAPYHELGPNGRTLNSRCARFGDEHFAANPSAVEGETLSLMYPTARYAEGLLTLKRDPRDVVFALIVGVPATHGVSGTTWWRLRAIDRLLDPIATPAMAIILDGDSARVRALCSACRDDNANGRCDEGFNDVDENGRDASDCALALCGPGDPPLCTRDLDADGVCDPEEVETDYIDVNGNFVRDPNEPPYPRERLSAVPARRLVRTAREIGERGGQISVQSICERGFTDTIETILGDVRQVAVGTCD